MALHRIGNKPLLEPMLTQFTDAYVDGLVQDYSNSTANTLELLQSCTKPSIYGALGEGELICIVITHTITYWDVVIHLGLYPNVL